jgi:hypothetical protein
VVRLAFLIGWWLIGLYLGSVTLNVYNQVRQDIPDLFNRATLVRVLLLPDVLGDDRTPLAAFIPVDVVLPS